MHHDYITTSLQLFRMTTSELIRSARHHAGLTQKELADKIGSHQHEISDWETGMHIPSAEKLLKIINVCQFYIDKSQPDQPYISPLPV